MSHKSIKGILHHYIQYFQMHITNMYLCIKHKKVEKYLCIEQQQCVTEVE